MDKKHRILVMDDEPLIRKMLGMSLHLLGYEAAFAAEGNEAITLYKKAKEENNPFSAVILDLTVPAGNLGGREAVKELLLIDPDVKAIASSGYSNDESIEKFSKHGFTAAIVKPYGIEELKQILKKAIGDE